MSASDKAVLEEAEAEEEFRVK